MKKWSKEDAEVRIMMVADQLIKLYGITGQTHDEICFNDGKTKRSWKVKVTSNLWSEGSDNRRISECYGV